MKIIQQPFTRIFLSKPLLLSIKKTDQQVLEHRKKETYLEQLQKTNKNLANCNNLMCPNFF